MVSRSNHLAILRFPAQADQITELMRRDEEFAGICRDYADIVGDINKKESNSGGSSAMLPDLHRLRVDLERDILEKLGEVGSDDTKDSN